MQEETRLAIAESSFIIPKMALNSNAMWKSFHITDFSHYWNDSKINFSNVVIMFHSFGHEICIVNQGVDAVCYPNDYKTFFCSMYSERGWFTLQSRNQLS